MSSGDEANRRRFGAIPGVPEGTTFRSRGELSEVGVHRPLQAGICGSAFEGAESVVLSGGYEDDEDRGDEILYTGEGGNDRTTGRQTANQVLMRGNLALARSMAHGLPVRVIRGSQHPSEHAPPLGYRYDGLYRVEDCWHETGRSGWRIWRFRLRKITVDLVLPSGPVRESPGEYDTSRENAPAPRRSGMVSRIIRDTDAARAVKRLHDYTCQICGTRLETPAGPYAEAAHIRPLGRPHDGPDTLSNLLCLCPNCHVLFDLGALPLEEDGGIVGTTERLRTARGHQIASEHLRYRRDHYG